MYDQLAQVSIHTPNEGSDCTNDLKQHGEMRFQSTLPMKGVTLITCTTSPLSMFQSTLPMKGVTIARSYLRDRDDVSIHTPNEGSDNAIRRRITINVGFQSTLPMKGVTLPSH